MVIRQDDNSPTFAALPLGLSADSRIKLGHYRVITVISYYDRLSVYRRGQGCFRSRQKLADMLGMSLSAFASFLNDLIEWGYLTMERHTKLRNTMTYRVSFPSFETVVGKTTGLNGWCG